MLMDDAATVFTRYTDALRHTGARLVDGAPNSAPDGSDVEDSGGEAGIGDALGSVWHGAKEALRQLTYWQMKKRAGVVGQAGLGPTIGRLHGTAPGLRVHLVGHSFGARLVSYALAGLPAGVTPSPVKGVTLLEGAFSQWAFASSLPFDVARRGALAGMPARIDGPLAVVHSSHDGAVGTFYPLASMASGEDSAGIGDSASRWGGIGANGAQGAGAHDDAVRGTGAGAAYPFAPGSILNIDASDVVRAGAAPSGAHSDIVHAELTWILATAGGIIPA
jgi:pimeloyl-ACP methyl ester carboxylesterase